MFLSKADDAFLNVHPNLFPLPTDTLAREKLLAHHSILRGEAVRSQLLLEALAGKCGEEGMRAWLSFYQEMYDLNPRRYKSYAGLLRASLQTAHDAHDRVLSDYVTMRDRAHLQMISDVATTRDPVDLVHLTHEAAQESAANPEDAITARTAFEGKRLLWLMQLEFEASLYGLSRESLTGDMRRFTTKLEEVYFEPKRSDRFMLEADLDPKNYWRVKGEPRIRSRTETAGERNNGYERVSFPLDVRYVCVAGKRIPVFYDNRVKEFLSLKLIRKCERDPRALHDLRGAKFVFFSEQELGLAVAHLRNVLVRYPGCVFGEASSLERSGVLDAANGSSANEFRAWKFNILLFGRYFELQFMLVGDWINERLSHGRENHELYKLRAYLDQLLPRLWPQAMYDVDWADALLRARLHEAKLHDIGVATLPAPT